MGHTHRRPRTALQGPPRSAGVAAGHRCYSPELGRWLSRDPIEERGGAHLYVYVRANPIGKIDPFGLEEKKECKAECNLGEAGYCDFKGFWYSPISPEGRKLIDEARDLAGQKPPQLPPNCPKELLKKFVTLPISAIESAAQGGGVLIDGLEEWARNHWPWGMYIKYSARHCETPCQCQCGKGEWGKKEDRYFYCSEQFYREEFTTAHRRECFKRWKGMCGGEFTFNDIDRYDPD